MRVLVCGGRDYVDDPPRMQSVLDPLKISVLIHGGARGADTLAGEYAKAHGIRTEIYPADWEKYGRRAGYLRNVEMLRLGMPQLVVAFPGGKGTAMMLSLARTANCPTMEVS